MNQTKGTRNNDIPQTLTKTLRACQYKTLRAHRHERPGKAQQQKNAQINHLNQMSLTPLKSNAACVHLQIQLLAFLR